MPEPLTLALHGFGSREKTALVLYLARHLPSGYRIVEGPARLPIFSLDTSEGERAWRRHAAESGWPCIVLSLQERRLPNAHWLSRPPELPALLALIERLAVRPPPPEPLRMALGDSPRRWFSGARDAVYFDPASRDALFYDPGDYFQGTLMRALSWARGTKQAVQVEGGGVRMIVRAGGESIFTESRGAQLKTLGFLSRAGGHVFALGVHERYGTPWCNAADPRVWLADDLVWRLAIWTSRGRVPRGTALDMPVGLRRWPNFTRMQRSPHAMRIVALWHVRPTSLFETARQLGLPCRMVFSVYSACSALGLLCIAQTQGPETAAAAPAAATAASLPRRVFNALLGRLRRAGD